jgi:hypothetical protein
VLIPDATTVGCRAVVNAIPGVSMMRSVLSAASAIVA